MWEDKELPVEIKKTYLVAATRVKNVQENQMVYAFLKISWERANDVYVNFIKPFSLYLTCTIKKVTYNVRLN